MSYATEHQQCLLCLEESTFGTLQFTVSVECSWIRKFTASARLSPCLILFRTSSREEPSCLHPKMRQSGLPRQQALYKYRHRTEVVSRVLSRLSLCTPMARTDSLGMELLRARAAQPRNVISEASQRSKGPHLRNTQRLESVHVVVPFIVIESQHALENPASLLRVLKMGSSVLLFSITR